MRHEFGIDGTELKRDKRKPIVWDSDQVVNPHMLIAGMSGAGKTVLVNDFIRSCVNTAEPGYQVRFHVFDVQGDMRIPGSSDILFSEQGQCGLNPLRVNADKHYGGPRKKIQGFIEIVNNSSRTALGSRQEKVLRTILEDLYALHGFQQDRPETWYIDEGANQVLDDGSNRLYLDVPFAEKDQAKAFGAKFERSVNCWWIETENYAGEITNWLPKMVVRRQPTVHDAVLMGKRILLTAFLGSDQKAVNHLLAFNKLAKTHSRKVIDALKRGDRTHWEDEAQQTAMVTAGKKAIDGYCEYIESVKTGAELDNVMKYASIDVLASVVDRLESLEKTGIFKSQPITFNDSTPVWRYELAPLRVEEQRMFVMFRLEELFDAAVRRGVETRVIDIYILDEFSRYATAASDDDNIVNRIAREGRKYKASLVACAQDPLSFPNGLVSSVGAKVILRVDELFWRPLVGKMAIDLNLVQWIRIHRTMAVQIKDKAAVDNSWKYCILEKRDAAGLKVA